MTSKDRPYPKSWRSVVTPFGHREANGSVVPRIHYKEGV